MDTLLSRGPVALNSIVMPTVSVVIPTLNEARNLPYVLPRIPDWVREIVIVDGLSTDNTVSVARALSPKVRVVMERARGKGAALRRGFAAAMGDIIVAMDADGSTRPEEIGAMVEALVAGADFVAGSRFASTSAGSEDLTEVRKLGNWALLTLVKLLFGGDHTDLNYGFNAFWRRDLPILALDATGFEIETQMRVRALRLGFKMVEASCFEVRRIHGQGNLKAVPDGWRVLKTILREAWLGIHERHPMYLPGEAAPVVWESVPFPVSPAVIAEAAPAAAPDGVQSRVV